MKCDFDKRTFFNNKTSKKRRIKKELLKWWPLRKCSPFRSSPFCCYLIIKTAPFIWSVMHYCFTPETIEIDWFDVDLIERANFSSSRIHNWMRSIFSKMNAFLIWLLAHCMSSTLSSSFRLGSHKRTCFWHPLCFTASMLLSLDCILCRKGMVQYRQIIISIRENASSARILTYPKRKKEKIETAARRTSDFQNYWN